MQSWLDIRFHVLKLISLETFLTVYRFADDIAEDDRAANQINGMLMLALSYCHQFIYHHTRTRGGLLGESPFTVSTNHDSLHPPKDSPSESRRIRKS